jgi:hypothetical protein
LLRVISLITTVIASSFLFGFSSATVATAAEATPGTPVSQASPVPATLAQTAAGAAALEDVPANSWAYAAVQQLVNDGILTGYPDGTFKGNRPMTRYEMAVAVNRAISYAEAEFEAKKAVSPEDLATLRKLTDYLDNEVKTIEAHLRALDTRVASDEKQLAATQQTAQTAATTAARAHFSAWLWDRPGVFSTNVVAVNGPIANAAAPAYGVLAPGYGAAPEGNAAVGSLGTGSGPDRQNSLITGNTNHPFNLMDFRLLLNGQLDSHFSYGSRLEDIMESNSPSGLSLTTPGFCTASYTQSGGCGVEGFTQYAETLRLNYAFIRYGSPGGVYAKVGRLNQDEGAYNPLQWAAGGNQVNGIQLGYGTSRFNAYVMGSTGSSSLTNSATAPACPINLQNCSKGSTLGLLAKADYWFPSTRTDIGATYDDYSAFQMQVWNPAAGLCTAGTTTTRVLPIGTPGGCSAYISAVQPGGGAVATPVTGAYQTVTTDVIEPSIFFAQYIGNKARPQFRAAAEMMFRVGNNPLTGTRWDGNRAFNAGITFASKGNLLYGGPVYGYGAKGSNFIDLEYYNIGLNGLSVDGGPTSAIGYQSFLWNNQQGYQSYLASVGRWLSNDVKAALVYQYFSNIPGVDIPAGSNTCPACYLKSVNMNTLNLDLMLEF